MKKKYTRKKTSKNSCRPQQESPAWRNWQLHEIVLGKSALYV
jgi:hypothetical protein